MASQFHKIDWYDASEDTTTEITKALAASSEEGIDATIGNCKLNLNNKIADATNLFGTFGANTFAHGTDTITIYANNTGSFSSSDIIFYGAVDGIKMINKAKNSTVELNCKNQMYKVMSKLISRSYEGRTASEIVINLAGRLGISTGTVTATTKTLTIDWTNAKAIDALTQLSSPENTDGDYFMLYFDLEGKLNFVKRTSSVATLSGNLIYFVWGPEVAVSGWEQIPIIDAAFEKRKDKMVNTFRVTLGLDMDKNPVSMTIRDIDSVIENGESQDEYCAKDIMEQVKFNESRNHGNKLDEYPSSYNYVMTFSDPSEDPVTPAVWTTDEEITMTGTSAQNLSEGTCVALSEIVTHLDGAPVYMKDIDYEMDYENGTITRKATGSISDGQHVYVDYASPALVATSDDDFNDYITARAKQLTRIRVQKMLNKYAPLPWKGTLQIKGRNDLQIGWLANIVIPRMATTVTDDFTSSYPVTFRITDLKHKITTQGWVTNLTVEEYIRPSV